MYIQFEHVIDILLTMPHIVVKVNTPGMLLNGEAKWVWLHLQK